MVELNVERAGRVKTWVTVVEIDAALRVEKATVGMDDGRSPEGRVTMRSVKARVRRPERQQVVRRLAKITYPFPGAEVTMVGAEAACPDVG
jgi:hypothetical protein